MRVTAVLVTLGATAASAQVVADPDYWKQTTEHRNIVNRFVYGQSPQSIPASYDPVLEAEQILAQQQRTLPSSNPKAPSLWRQIRGVTVRSALSTAPRALGTIGLAVGVGYVGWKIGSGINAKFLKLGVPEAIPHTITDFRGNGFRQDLVWHSGGFYAEGGGKVIQPEAGFTWTRYTDSGAYYYWKTGAPQVSCDHHRVAPPLGLTLVTSAFPGKDCGYGADRASTTTTSPTSRKTHSEPRRQSSLTRASPTAAQARPRRRRLRRPSSKRSTPSSASPKTPTCASGSTTSSAHPARPTRPESAHRIRSFSPRPRRARR